MQREREKKLIHDEQSYCPLRNAAVDAILFSQLKVTYMTKSVVTKKLGICYLASA